MDSRTFNLLSRNPVQGGYGAIADPGIPPANGRRTPAAGPPELRNHPLGVSRGPFTDYFNK